MRIHWKVRFGQSGYDIFCSFRVFPLVSPTRTSGVTKFGAGLVPFLARGTVAKCYPLALDQECFEGAHETSRVHRGTRRRGGGMAAHVAGAAARNTAPDSDFPSGNPDDPTYRNGWWERMAGIFR